MIFFNRNQYYLRLSNQANNNYQLFSLVNNYCSLLSQANSKLNCEQTVAQFNLLTNYCLIVTINYYCRSARQIV